MEERGLKVSRKKTKYMVYNEANDRSVIMQECVLQKVTKFKYPGSMMSEDGEPDEEVERGSKQIGQTGGGC